MNKQGIDVSKWQPQIDWQKVKADGIDFAIIRVGFCYNNGALKLDSAFMQHIKGALAAGLDVGVYLYSYATTAQAARRAAQEVVKAVKPYKLTYPIAFDIEYESIYTGGSKQVNTEICKAFLEEVEQAGYYAMLYCSKDFLDSYLYPAQLTAYDKWIAQYAGKCTCKHPYGIWQYTGTGRVNGIVGDVDRDIAYKDYPSIIAKMEQPQADKKLLYTVQVGAFSSAKSAADLYTKLSDMGYFTFLRNETLVKVCVGKFPTQQDAQKTADDLKKKGFGGFVTIL